ncbi:DUF3115 superfamily domain-containing protein [Histoplasma capsulatum G186AR]|uniref:DUF3115 superfamily domain-containing protein n=1 Tax=Ajellomyces capsulatus TaxID=5037 RepID=A0A8H8D864_AJECA|nr:DUF3115 superfamily domain-containing protein [Histoplasma capsulatum]QSS68841.1 DUF3115 superfamily domain-containing protein [Histoplasma capsulatum G186AR]
MRWSQHRFLTLIRNLQASNRFQISRSPLSILLTGLPLSTPSTKQFYPNLYRRRWLALRR